MNRLNGDEPLYTISIAARLVRRDKPEEPDIHPHTLRMYERLGLITPRRVGKNRLYSDRDIERYLSGGFTVNEVSDADAAGVAVKRKIIARSERVYLVADHTKAGITQFATIATWNAFDGLITDQAPNDMLVRALADAHVELRIAEQGKAGLAA